MASSSNSSMGSADGVAERMSAIRRRCGSTMFLNGSYLAAGTPCLSSHPRRSRSRKIERRTKVARLGSAVYQPSQCVIVSRRVSETIGPLPRSCFSLFAGIDRHPEVADRKNRLVVRDAFLLEKLSGPLQAVHECENEDDLALHFFHRLDGLEGGGALGKHVIDDDDPRPTFQVALDE